MCVRHAVRKLLFGLRILIALGSSGSNATGHVVIDWIDFIKWNGVTYVADPTLGPELAPTAVGGQIGTVRKKVADVVNDTRYQTQDGDAAVLSIGTAIYALKDYRRSFRIAVQTSGVRLYEADTDPHATVGSDLLDLAGKVAAIEITAGVGETRTVSDAATVNRLIELVLNSPVNQSIQPPDTSADRITFHFADGSRSERAFWPSAALLGRGIVVPREFVQIVTDALR